LRKVDGDDLGKNRSAGLFKQNHHVAVPKGKRREKRRKSKTGKTQDLFRVLKEKRGGGTRRNPRDVTTHLFKSKGPETLGRLGSSA